MPYDRSAIITRNPIARVAFDFMASAEDYIAEKLFTAKIVQNSRTKSTHFDTSKLRVTETRKATNSEADLVDEQIYTRDITLEEHKLGSEVNPRDVRDADMPELVGDSRKAKLVMHHLLQKREELAKDLATTTTNYPSDLTSAIGSGSRWNEADGDPEAFKLTTVDPALRARCGRSANALAIDVSTYEKLIVAPSLKERIKYSSKDPITDGELKAYFHVDHLFVGRAQYDSAAEGATASIGGFWGTNAIFFVYNPSVALEDVSYGHMYLNGNIWSETNVDKKRNGPAGSMRRVEIGMEYKLDRGYVVSSSDSDFAAGYLARTVVA